MIKAVIFDMDGLLIDSEPFWQQAQTEAFATVGIKLTPELCLQTMGLRPDLMVSYWYERFPWSSKTQKQVQTEVEQRVMQLVELYGRPKEGVEAVISLFESKHLPLAIASSSPFVLIHAVLKKLSLAHRMKAVHSAEEELFGKPHPATYLAAARKLGVNPEHCLAFEDSLNGMLSAKSARMKVVAVPESSHLASTRYDFCDLTLRSLLEFTEERFDQLQR